MLGNLGGVHLLIILAIVVLFFGAAKLPALAKGLGQSINVFKKEMDTKDTKSNPADPLAPPQPASSAAPQTAAPQYGAPQYHAPQQQAPVVNPGPSVQPNQDHSVQ